MSSMKRGPPGSVSSPHVVISPIGERKSLRVDEMKLNGSSYRSCSEIGRECSRESLRWDVRHQLGKGTLCDRRRVTGTLFGDVLDFDGVGIAIEPEDGIVRRHCGRFTIHREEDWARDGEARGRKREREEGEIRATSQRWDWYPTDGSGQRTRNQVEPNILVFIPQPSLPRSITLPAGRKRRIRWHPSKSPPSRSQGQPSSRCHKQATRRRTSWRPQHRRVWPEVTCSLSDHGAGPHILMGITYHLPEKFRARHIRPVVSTDLVCWP